MKHALPSAFSEAASTTSVVVVEGVAAAVVEGVVAETRAPVVSSARRFAAFTSDSLFTLCAATRPRTGAAGAAVTGTSLRVSASSFALTSLVNAFRSWRYALRSRELSRICCWMFSDMAAMAGGGETRVGGDGGRGGGGANARAGRRASPPRTMGGTAALTIGTSSRRAQKGECSKGPQNQTLEYKYAEFGRLDPNEALHHVRLRLCPSG